MSLINHGAVCSVIWQAFKVMVLLLKLNFLDCISLSCRYPKHHCPTNVIPPPMHTILLAMSFSAILSLFMLITFPTQRCHLSLRHFQQLQWSGIAETRFQQSKNVSYRQALVSVLQTERGTSFYTLFCSNRFTRRNPSQRYRFLYW